MKSIRLYNYQKDTKKNYLYSNLTSLENIEKA